jgi:hypothetical protein
MTVLSLNLHKHCHSHVFQRYNTSEDVDGVNERVVIITLAAHYPMNNKPRISRNTFNQGD